MACTSPRQVSEFFMASHLLDMNDHDVANNRQYIMHYAGEKEWKINSMPWMNHSFSADETDFEKRW